MSKLFLIVAFFFIIPIANSQVVNTPWFEDDSIGVGTDMPEEILDVNGSLQLRRLSDDQLSNSSTLKFQSVADVIKFWNVQIWNDNSEFPLLTFFEDIEKPRFQLKGDVGWAFYDENFDPEIYSDGVAGGGIYIPGVLSVGTLSTANFSAHSISCTNLTSAQLQYNNNQISFSGNIVNYKASGGSSITTAAHNFTVNTPLTNSNANIASFSNGGSALLRVDKDGNLISTKDISTSAKVKIGVGSVNIGTHSLAVNGSAIFTKAHVKLTGNWPDYVFEPDYELPSLTYIENFIKQYKHLPEMPSAKEVSESDIDLGEIQTLLLKKIEELTLYIIDQEKRIKELESKLNDK